MSEELVFVVDRDLVFPRVTPQGLVFQVSSILERCAAHGRFLPRSRVETDPNQKQLIPYIVLYHEDSLFCVRRLRTQSEARLHDLWSLGIGGHMNPVPDIKAFPDLLEANARRELHEELLLAEELTVRWSAAVNDDSNAVGQVHLGLIGLAEARPRSVQVRERDKMTGAFRPYPQLSRCVDSFETWSQLILSSWSDLERRGAGQGKRG